MATILQLFCKTHSCPLTNFQGRTLVNTAQFALGAQAAYPAPVINPPVIILLCVGIFIVSMIDIVIDLWREFLEAEFDVHDYE